ncbi:MAG: hypothetical protein J6Y02_17245 [Pseudobutyrivibrio sp.]|nr:hypothetical protein [Pseudobutyrivibrio sp.]
MGSNNTEPLYGIWMNDYGMVEVKPLPIANIGIWPEDTCGKSGDYALAQDCSCTINPYSLDIGEEALKRYIEQEEKEEVKSIAIERVVFSGPATIVFWDDGTKTVVKCTDGDDYSYEVGIAMATLKKIFGESYGTYRHAVRDAIDDAIERAEQKEEHRKHLVKKDIFGLEKIVEGLKKAYDIKDKP